jgi:AcrR family transcriptional regulator
MLSTSHDARGDGAPSARCHAGDAAVPARSAAPLPAERLLDAARRLFVLEGIRAVGIERILAEANVARASLYQAFGSKDGLVAAYLREQDAADRAAWQDAASSAAGPRERILTLFDLAIASAPWRGFRGCLYHNALTEFPDPRHPVSGAVAEHRTWLREMLLMELAALGSADLEGDADTLQVLYDGALAGSKFSRSDAPIRVARRHAELLLTERTGSRSLDAGRGKL